MNCKNCGTEAKEGDKFCRKCGGSLLGENGHHKDQSRKKSVHPHGSSVTFFLLTFVTLGLYPVYWSWKAWRVLGTLREKEYWSFGRAIFYTINSYWLFKGVLQEAEKTGYSKKYQPAILALFVFVGALLIRGSSEPVESSVFWSLYFSGMLVISVCFSPVISALNAISESKEV